jgi:hypothetical protein
VTYRVTGSEEEQRNHVNWFCSRLQSRSQDLAQFSFHTLCLLVANFVSHASADDCFTLFFYGVTFPQLQETSIHLNTQAPFPPSLVLSLHALWPLPPHPYMDTSAILQTGTESRNRGNTNGATRCSAIRPLILIVVCYPPLQMPKALWFTKISCVYHRSLLQHRPPMLAYITSTSPSILASSYKHAFRNERTEHV